MSLVNKKGKVWSWYVKGKRCTLEGFDREVLEDLQPHPLAVKLELMDIDLEELEEYFNKERALNYSRMRSDLHFAFVTSGLEYRADSERIDFDAHISIFQNLFCDATGLPMKYNYQVVMRQINNGKLPYPIMAKLHDLVFNSEEIRLIKWEEMP